MIDFLRYVGRRRAEDPSVDRLSFETGWNVMVGGYAAMASKREPGEGSEGA